ncbi:MAG: energy-coupling factor transporter transmembrane component T [Bacillota bacterium]|nr:energy-coupling factor transporter transmembrane component T [Bacillota bacterium]
MNSTDTFSTYNPIINFAFFIGAIAFGMIFVHPAFLVCACALSAAYYLTIKGLRGLKLIVGMIPVYLFLSLINPVLNTRGQQVLFTYFGGRPYTLEALYYGMALAAIFVSVILWFAAYNAVMTSDKFLYLFGRVIPSISLILTMVLRLVPGFQRKTVQISSARRCIGKAGSGETKMERAENGMTIVSALTSWALEGGIVTADSMRSRGYGSGRRSTFSIYRFEMRDKLLLGCMILLIGVIFFCSAGGATKASYTPVFEIAPVDNIYSVVGIAAYAVFLIIPTALNIMEALTWHILRSRI